MVVQLLAVSKVVSLIPKPGFLSVLCVCASRRPLTHFKDVHARVSGNCKMAKVMIVSANCYCGLVKNKFVSQTS